MKRKLLTAAVILTASSPTFAYTVYVAGSAPITTQVVPALSTMQATLAEILTTNTQIGSAITQASDKNTATLTEGFQAQRKADIFGRETERLERARDSYSVPDSICSESASGVAHQVHNAARASASSLATGGGITDVAIQKAVASAPVLPAKDDYRSAAIHAKYCTAAEYEVYGGTALCQSASADMPGGDIQVQSLYDGAGSAGKAPDLTFSDDQIDAGMAYMRNSAKHSPGRTLGKGEIKNETGWQYQGLMTQYKAIQSAAQQPQLSMIGDSKPNSSTTTALKEALENPSAQAYFNDTASDLAKSNYQMSAREFESFEVGRRYANANYQEDLQEMNGDNLMRELIRVQSLSNYLQLGIKNQLRESNILAGQQLALAADREYRPQLQALMQEISGGVAK
ncbi:conjugal transfer protein TraW [Serratia ficaria]|uniref:conjugal transfer protein TraW n=1 Tax=Serratia ficaria TaxID=61651 RepID=UPI00077C13D2|nr:conjugal transfer protein TraW [Serratia ficaria]